MCPAAAPRGLSGKKGAEGKVCLFHTWVFGMREQERVLIYEVFEAEISVSVGSGTLTPSFAYSDLIYSMSECLAHFSSLHASQDGIMPVNILEQCFDLIRCFLTQQGVVRDVVEGIPRVDAFLSSGHASQGLQHRCDLSI